MTQATSLSRVFNPRSVAFYGASNNPMTMGTAQLATLMAQGYQGKIYPIHPREEKVLGLPAYKTISELPETPDLTVIVLPTKIVPGILEECGRAGVKAVIVVSGGFREIGESGVNLERELVQITRKYDIALIGPNCIGVTNFNIGLNTTYFHNPGKSGGITIISQSGTYSCQIYDYLKGLGANLSHTVSVGNSAITDMSDFLYYFADEPTTKSIALYIEGISNGEKFIRAARYASERKPVVALYVGGTPAGARAGLSHTGALAGKDSVYEGVFGQTGIIRTNNFEELLDLAWALALLPPAKGRKICILTNSGGPGASMADSCARAGLEVPLLSDELQSKIHRVLPSTAAYANPIDMTFFKDIDEMYVNIPRMVMESRETDGVLLYGVFGPRVFGQTQKLFERVLNLDGSDDLSELVKRLEQVAQLPQNHDKPLVASSFWSAEDEASRWLIQNGIPVYPTPDRSVKAMWGLCKRWEILESFKDG